MPSMSMEVVVTMPIPVKIKLIPNQTRVRVTLRLSVKKGNAQKTVPNMHVMKKTFFFGKIRTSLGVIDMPINMPTINVAPIGVM